jgi:hypothetical protein
VDILTGPFGKAERLCDADMTQLRAFAFRVQEHVTEQAFTKISFILPLAELPSWKTILSRVVFLSGIKPVLYDRCPKSCICYTHEYAELDACPFCKEARRDSKGLARAHFTYLPLIPRLKAMLANRDHANLMDYRANLKHEPDKTADIFDGKAYRTLLDEYVTIEGKRMKHKHFNGRRDVAMGLSTDGFALFKKRKKSAWPLILFNYNLPPDIRFHREHIISLGIIPKKPKDTDSFLWPLVEELLKLEAGVTAYDGRNEEYFILRAYLMLVFGDIPAVSMLMQMTGHNGYTPCRMCSIHGIRVPGQHPCPYYLPLDRSRHPDVRAPESTRTARYDPLNLPLRTHDKMMQQAQAAQTAPTKAAQGRIATATGMKGVSILSRLSSIRLPTSFPYDFMHLIWENLIKNLVLLWTGEYKGLDEGHEEYHLSKKVWEAIGEACAASGSTIPGAYGARPPNVATDSYAWTADSRSFWTMYLGPILLKGRFKKPRYYEHFVRLVKLLNICLQFECTDADIENLRTGFATWVQDFERCVSFSCGENFHTD